MRERPEAKEILELERGALARWCNGDPSGFLEISAPDVVYFDPFLDAPIEGLDALARYYEALRGKVRVARYEILHPRVTMLGDAAALAFRFDSFGGNEDRHRWNCTEVYRRDPAGFRIVQTHWSFTEGRRAGVTLSADPAG